MKRGVIILVVLAMAVPLHCLAGEQLKSYHHVPEILLLSRQGFEDCKSHCRRPVRLEFAVRLPSGAGPNRGNGTPIGGR